jgi:hypothetical protein
MALVKMSDTLARSAYRVAAVDDFRGKIGTHAAVQALLKLDQLARDDIRAGSPFRKSALTDAAIPTKRLQANIDTQNAKLEHEGY